MTPQEVPACSFSKSHHSRPAAQGKQALTGYFVAMCCPGVSFLSGVMMFTHSYVIYQYSINTYRKYSYFNSVGFVRVAIQTLNCSYAPQHQSSGAWDVPQRRKKKG